MESDRVPSGWGEGSVRSNEIDLHYARSGGDGPPIVVSHGVFDDGVCRLPLARALDDAYDVVLYDARGHGCSDAPRDGYSAETMATDLLGLVDGLDLDDPVLFGHSMGGDAVEWVEATGTGEVYAHSTAPSVAGWPDDDLPLIVAYVELDEGPRVMTNVDADPEAVAVGTRVRATFVETDDPDVAVPVFVPVE